MTVYSAKIKGMSCNSCENLIRKVLEKYSARPIYVDHVSGTAVFELDDYEKTAMITKELEEKGYTIAEIIYGKTEEKKQQISCRCNGFQDYLANILNGTIQEEHKIIKYSLLAFALLVASFTMIGPSTLGILNKNMFPMLVLTAVASVVSVAANEIIMLYNKKMSCQNSMMAGMTTGMAIGLMFGGILGATNGMFIGSIVGIAMGSYYGIKAGNCHGTMGIMEGIMAAFMGGTMGAMLSVMMINDNLLPFLIIMFGICISVLAALLYVLYRDETERSFKLESDFSIFIAKAFAIFYLVVVAIAFLPATGLTYSTVSA